MATALYDRGELQKAEDVLDKCVATLPARNFPYNVSGFRSLNEWAVISIVELYFQVGKPEKAVAVGNQLAKETLESMLYYTTPLGPGDDDIISKKLSDDAASTYLYLIKIYNAYGCSDAAKALEDKLKGV